MPNWCYTEVCFKGKPENIKRLDKDIEAATHFCHRNRSYCNIRYFMHLNGFDTASYRERFMSKYIPHYYDCNFRGSVSAYNEPDDELIDDEGYITYYATFEMAWYTDYQLLQLISMIYDVTFSAYSEEPGCQVYDKCSNDDSINEYDFNCIISPDYDQFEEVLYGDDIDKRRDVEDLGYDNAVKEGDSDYHRIINTLKKHDIEYEIKVIKTYPVPTPFGVYYHYMYGVVFDTDTDIKFCRYPEIDEFNRYLIKGVTYDTD